MLVKGINMFRARFLKTSSLAGVAAITAVGLMVAAAPAQAIPPVPSAPGNCADFAFPGSVNLNISSGDKLSFSANGKDSSGPATWSNNTNFPGTFVGSIGLTFVDIDFTDDKGTTHLQGKIAPNGIASGSVRELSGVTWTSTSPFTCVEAASAAATPGQGPTVTFNNILGGMQAQITDRSGVTSQCTYTADNGFTRSFGLNANSTFKLNIVPAIPELRNWTVSVACDNGTRTDTTTFF
jgi:hypothetical protein